MRFPRFNKWWLVVGGAVVLLIILLATGFIQWLAWKGLVILYVVTSILLRIVFNLVGIAIIILAILHGKKLAKELKEAGGGHGHH